MASTLPPPANVDTRIPIVTPNGGSAAAYKDPNSPESIMKKTHSMNVQTKVDGKYDVAVSPYEGFCSDTDVSPFLWILLIGILLYTCSRMKKLYVCLLAIVVILALYQKLWLSRND